MWRSTTLRYCNLRGDVASLAALRDLRHVNLAHVPIISGDVTAFGFLPRLSHANLFYCRGLAGSLDAFLSLGDLVYLNVQQCPDLTDVLRFFHARPRVETLFDRVRNPTKRPGAPRDDKDRDEGEDDGALAAVAPLPQAAVKLAPLSRDDRKKARGRPRGRKARPR